MSKYIKLEDAIRKYAEMFADEAYWEHGVGDGKPDEEDLDIAREYYSDLPTIEIPTELNGVILKDCDKVIAPFLEEHECDELWETVRALRDFYDWITEEERRDNE